MDADQRNTLQTFQEITQIHDEQVALQVLQQNNWNLDNAVNQFVNNQNDESTRNNGVVNTASRPSSSSSSSNNGFVGGLLRWFFQTRPVSLNPELDTRKFIDEYDLKFGQEHPAFHNGSYQSAVANAFQNSKYLLVYLHSPMHDDTNKFCSQVLKSSNVINLTNQNMVVWAGRIWDPEAYGLSGQLRASSFPFLALLICQSNRAVQLADKIQGYVDERELVERLQGTMTAYNHQITRNRTEANRREEATRLREQQDREYRESVERERRERLLREEEERKREQEEEERKQQEELKNAMELSKKLSYEDTIRKLRLLVEQQIPEPPVNVTVDVATIRFQLPRGMKLQRRFMKTTTVQQIFDYLRVYFADNNNNNNDQPIISNFSVSTHFPKVELTDMTVTIDTLGLCPRGMLYVHDLDS